MYSAHFLMVVLSVRTVIPYCQENIRDCPKECNCQNKGKDFTADCRKSDLNVGPSVIPQSTSAFILSDNSIPAIGKRGFLYCFKLKTLDLYFNTTSQINREAFNDLSRLEALYLQNNLLKLQDTEFLPIGVLNPLVELEILVMHHNDWLHMRRYRDDLAQNKVHLQVLSLDAPGGNVQLSTTYSGLTLLKTLQLYGGLFAVENDTFIALANVTVRELALLGGNVRSLDALTFSHLPYLTMIDLSGNRNLGLGSSPYRAWYGLRKSNLKILKLNSMVQEFDYQTYNLEEQFLYYLMDVYNMRHLRYLDLSNQSRYPKTHVGGRHHRTLSFFIPPARSQLNLTAAFQAAYPSVKSVVLITNNTGLDYIEISENRVAAATDRIMVLTNKTFKFGYVNISSCGITYISNTFVQPPVKVDTLDFSLKNCGAMLSKDTNGSWLLQFHQAQARMMNFGGNNIKSLSADSFSQITNLNEIILHNNELNVWQSSIGHMANLTLLDLSENALPYLSQRTCEELDNISRNGRLRLNLENNPLDYNCSSLDFLKWMLKTQVHIINRNEYTCCEFGSEITLGNLTEIVQALVLKCASKSWMIATGVGTLLLALLVIVSAVFYHHRWNIRYCCLKFVGQRKKYQELQDERTFQFDAFVAYHHDDLPWVIHQVLPNLEHGEDAVELCLHHRNWLPGLSIEENISVSVEHSRKTLVVLSRSFLKSGWCQFEMEIAHWRGIEESREIVIVVALEDIAMEVMSTTLANLRQTNTWIDWFEHENDRDNFWVLLKRAIGRRSNTPT